MNITTELHEAASNMNIKQCLALINPNPNTVILLDERGHTPLHCLLIAFFKHHPKLYYQSDKLAIANLTREMMQANPKMIEHLSSLLDVAHYRHMSFHGCYPTQIETTLITVPEIHQALTSSMSVEKGIVGGLFGFFAQPRQEAEADEDQRLEDYARNVLGDESLADELLIDRELINAYENAYIGK